MSKLYIVGIGPGSADFVTPAALEVVKNSQIVIGSKRALELFPEAREVLPLSVNDIQEKLEYAVELAKEKKDVCVLSTGDPGFSGVLSPIKRIIQEKNYIDLEVDVIPGISSIQLCAARAEIPWDNADLLSFHGNENLQEILAIIDNGRPTIALPYGDSADTAQFLIKQGIDPLRQVTICEKLSYEAEKIVQSTLQEVAKTDFSYMCVMIIH